MRVIARDESRSEHDDFVLNVQPYMQDSDGATLFGEVWIIKPMYELHLSAANLPAATEKGEIS